MNRERLSLRRNFLGATGAIAAITAVGQVSGAEEEEVSPAEDLMREHGVLKRVLLVYREAVRRIDAHEDLPPEALRASAKLIRNFVEDYHEKLEQDYLFPRFRKAGKLVDLVNVLENQHKQGRLVTDVTLQLATSHALKDTSQRARLRESLLQFVRMYEPHEAREDTVLFPAFHELVSRHEYDALGEEFEKKENQLFGGEGFEKNVAAIAAIEKKLGIYELTQFTPKGM